MRNINLEREAFTEKEKRNIDILEILRRKGPISRPEISKEMGINVVTISNYLDDFIKNRLVYEKEYDVSEGGRRPLLLDLNPSGGYIIGVGLNLLNMVGILMDIKGNIVLKTQIEHPGVDVDSVVRGLLDTVREIIRRSKDYAPQIKGIGIGIAGIIDHKEGTVRWPERISRNNTNYASINVRLKDVVEKEFGLPVLVENDATAACFGEYWLQLGPTIKNLLFMFSGVGCGILINGQIYNGARGCAGEPSVYNYKEDALFNCELGNPCFLKRWETDLGIVDDFKEALANDNESAIKFFKLVSNNNANTVDLKNIFMAYKAKQPLAVSVMDKAAKRVGIKIAYLVNLLNPEIVVIGGGLEEAGDDFLSKVVSAVREWTFREAAEDLNIVYSQLRENAVALGAASMVMQKLFARVW